MKVLFVYNGVRKPNLYRLVLSQQENIYFILKQLCFKYLFYINLTTYALNIISADILKDIFANQPPNRLNKSLHLIFVINP